MKRTFPRVRELLQEEVRKYNSVNKVSLKTGLTNNTIAKYLEGVSEPQQDTLEKLSVYFKKPVAWLRGDTDDQTQYPPTADLVDLSALTDVQREGWALLRQLPPRQLQKAMKLLELFSSDD